MVVVYKDGGEDNDGTTESLDGDDDGGRGSSECGAAVMMVVAEWSVDSRLSAEYEMQPENKEK